MKIKKFQKGVALYISVMIMTFLLAIGLGLTALIVGQLSIMKNIGDSVIAFHAADTGIEAALYEKRKNENSNLPFFKLDCTTASCGLDYTVTFYQDSGKAISVGSYRGTKRAIEAEHAAVFDFCLEGPVPCVNPNPVSLCIKPGTLGGSPGTTTIITATLLSGITRDVIFSTDPDPVLPNINLPPNVSVDFSPTPCTPSPSCPSTLVFFIDGAAPEGTYPLTIYGTTDILQKTAAFTLTIDAALCP